MSMMGPGGPGNGPQMSGPSMSMAGGGPMMAGPHMSGVGPMSVSGPSMSGPPMSMMSGPGNGPPMAMMSGPGNGPMHMGPGGPGNGPMHMMGPGNVPMSMAGPGGGPMQMQMSGPNGPMQMSGPNGPMQMQGHNGQMPMSHSGPGGNMPDPRSSHPMSSPRGGGGPMHMGPGGPQSMGKIYPPNQSMVFNPANPNAPPIYPCGVCHKEVHENDQAILCESGCNFWFHRMCAGLTEPAFIMLTQEVYAEWVCDKCLNNKNIPLIKMKP